MKCNNIQNNNNKSIPVETDDAEPCTSSTSELVEKSRLRGSLRCHISDEAAMALLKWDLAGAELDNLANKSGLVAARLAGDLTVPAGWPEENVGVGVREPAAPVPAEEAATAAPAPEGDASVAVLLNVLCRAEVARCVGLCAAGEEIK